MRILERAILDRCMTTSYSETTRTFGRTRSGIITPPANVSQIADTLVMYSVRSGCSRGVVPSNVFLETFNCTVSPMCSVVIGAETSRSETQRRRHRTIATITPKTALHSTVRIAGTDTSPAILDSVNSGLAVAAAPAVGVAGSASVAVSHPAGCQSNDVFLPRLEMEPSITAALPSPLT